MIATLFSHDRTNVYFFYLSDPLEYANGIWKGFYVQFGNRYTMTMDIKFVSENDDKIIKGVGNDEIGDFDIHGKLHLSADKDHFDVNFVKMYRSAHSTLLYYKATIEVTNIMSMSGHWYYNKEGRPQDEFLLNKVSGKLI